MGVPKASSENLNLTASADYGIISVKTPKNGGARMIGFGFGFDLFQILFTILFVLVAVVIIVTIIRNLSQWHKNNQSPRLTVPATVVAKRVNVTHHRSATPPRLITPPSRWKAATGWSYRCPAANTDCWSRATGEISPSRAPGSWGLNAIESCKGLSR